jgi:hypothetical protein
MPKRSRTGPLVTVQICSSDSGEGDAPLLMLSWVIRPESAAAFTAGMTDLYGDPFEAVSTVGAAVAAAAAPDAPAFLDPGGRDAPVVYHAWPEGGMDDPLPCCGRTRHEISAADGMAFAAAAVTCRG